MNCPKCGGSVTVVPGKEGRVSVPTAVTYHVAGDRLPRVKVATTFTSCNECEFCWR